MKKMIFLSLLFSVFQLQVKAQTISPSVNNIIYVDSSVIGGNQSGDSWTNAIPNLSDALKYARSNMSNWSNDSLRIFIAQGSYKPRYNAEDNNFSADGGRNNAFVMVKNVQLFGGFNPAIGDSTMSTRNWVDNPTVLSGDLGVVNDSSDNSYHVVISSGNIGNALIDGFTVVNGFSPGGGSITVEGFSINMAFGGGMINEHSSPLIRNLIFKRNLASRGGGMYNGTSAPTLVNVTFRHNSSWSGGGGMLNENQAAPTLIHVTFSNNNSANGGAIYNDNAFPILKYVMIDSNASPHYNGGGMYNYNNSLPQLENVIITNNSSYNGGGMYNDNSSPQLKNVSIVNNTAQSTGGGMYNDNNSSPKLLNVLVANNSAQGQGGGILNFTSCSPTLTNVTIVNNHAQVNGAGLFCSFFSNPTINNSIIMFNRADTSIDNVYNDLFSLGHPTFTNTLIEGGTWDPNWGDDNGGNIASNANPFVDTSNENYELKICSLPIDAGSNNLYAIAGGDTLTDYDLNLNQRVFNNTIDMGALENEGAGIISGSDSVCVGDSIVLNSNVMGGDWSASNGNAMVDSTGKVTGLFAGHVVISYIVKGGCGNYTATKRIVVNPLPKASFTVSNLNDSTIRITNNSINATYFLWHYDNGDSSNIADSTFQFIYHSNGHYTIKLIAYNECGTDTAMKSVVIKKTNISNIELITSVSLSPNPFKNEINLRIKMVGVQKAQITIYNQIGREIYQSRKELRNGNNIIPLKEAFVGKPSGMYLIRIVLNDKENVLYKAVKIN